MKIYWLFLLFSVAWADRLWTKEWLNPLGCSNVTNATSCSFGTDVYGICTNDQCSRISENAELYGNLSQILIPLYDYSCLRNGTVTFIGHVALVVAEERSLVLLGFFTELHSIYDCKNHSRKTLNYPLMLYDIVLDTRPTTIYPGGGVPLNSSSPWQFNQTNVTWPENSKAPVALIANWTLPPNFDWNATADQWALSLTLAVQVEGKLMYLGLHGGLNPVPCFGSPLIKMEVTCQIANHQLRTMRRPPLTSTTHAWYMEARACQQFYSYHLGNIVSIELLNTSLTCPSPLVHNPTLNYSALGIMQAAVYPPPSHQPQSFTVGIGILLGTIILIIAALLVGSVVRTKCKKRQETPNGVELYTQTTPRETKIPVDAESSNFLKTVRKIFEHDALVESDELRTLDSDSDS